MEKRQRSEVSIGLFEAEAQSKSQDKSGVQMKKQVFTQKYQEKPKQKQNSGHWTSSENARYLVFIMHYKQMFEQNSKRKIWRIFKEMSNFIDTRNYIQCRSHHQKMLEQYQSIQRYVQLKGSVYSPRMISKIKAQLFEIKNKLKHQQNESTDRQLHRLSSQQNPQPIETKTTLEHVMSPTPFMTPCYGFNGYQPFNPFIYPQISYNYPFFWGQPQ